MNADELLMFGVEHRASDLYLQTGAIPSLRIDGQVHELKAAPLTDKQIRELIHAIAPSGSSFDIDTAMARGFDFSYAVGDKARFRCNLFSHLGTPALVLRVIPLRPPTLAELNLPPVLTEIIHLRRGLTLMSGTTGSGKTSTLAALLEVLNSNYHIKILTIEDPVEFVHTPSKAFISHVEVGRDTPSFEIGLRQALRQAPDVILVGELRDAETVRMALRAADTGHQVLATVHSANAAQTVERLLTMVPPDEMAVARQELAGALVGVISQRLAMSTRKTRWPVVEILRGDAVTSKYILDGKITDLADYLATGERKMQSFDMHAVELYRQGILTEAAALGAASNVDAVKFQMRAEGPQIKAV